MAAFGSRCLGVGLFLGFGKCAERQWRAESKSFARGEWWRDGEVEGWRDGGVGSLLTTELAGSSFLAAALMTQAESQQSVLSFRQDGLSPRLYMG